MLCDDPVLQANAHSTIQCPSIIRFNCTQAQLMMYRFNLDGGIEYGSYRTKAAFMPASLLFDTQSIVPNLMLMQDDVNYFSLKKPQPRTERPITPQQQIIAATTGAIVTSLFGKIYLSDMIYIR
jgi:hypothetical protein